MKKVGGMPNFGIELHKKKKGALAWGSMRSFATACALTLLVITLTSISAHPALACTTVAPELPDVGHARNGAPPLVSVCGRVPDDPLVDSTSISVCAYPPLLASEDALCLGYGMGAPDIPPSTCTSGTTVALPFTGVIPGNGDSWAQVYSDGIGNYYVSWRMSTNNLQNGADEWAFGIDLIAPGDDMVEGGRLHYESRSSTGLCRPVGFWPNPVEEFYIDAGAGGTSGQASCTVTFSWQTEVGFKITGPEGTVTLGGSVSCGGGVFFDSESLIRAEGGLGIV